MSNRPPLMQKPVIPDSSSFLSKYILLVDEDNLTDAFKNQLNDAETLFKIRISEDNAAMSYAPGKWSIKTLMQHLIDTERIFAYRALCSSRDEKQPLPGFDEELYANATCAEERTWKDLTEEFFTVRKSTELLFQSFTDDMFHKTGIANEQEYSAAMIAYAIVGHCKHHMQIINERYLKIT